MSRVFKRIIILGIVFSFHAILFGGVYFIFFRVAPTCVDGKQNQNEQGVDCGGVCVNACFVAVTTKEIQIQNVSFVAGGENQYDVVAVVKNPNESMGPTINHSSFFWSSQGCCSESQNDICF